MKPVLLILIVVTLSACGTVQKAQYSAMEKVGIHKRDILVDRIEETSDTQQEVKQRFQSAYEQLASLVEVDDQGLEKKYQKMARAVSASEDSARELDDRIASVDEVAKDLFAEWRQELNQYQSKSLRRTSEQNLKTTENRYAAIYRKMQIAQQRVDPVLKILQDNTLFLKHNLNARAVSSLSNEVLVIEGKVASLINQMQASIDESRNFIQTMQN
ncbi:MAG: DUF2959 domain-containing protein [Gammaproteobacteria bacterium]|nr:DUF2959 domain-containing protein [Gammaproteobacteria bacterium]